MDADVPQHSVAPCLMSWEQGVAARDETAGQSGDWRQIRGLLWVGYPPMR
jgi:hypothetical protein